MSVASLQDAALLRFAGQGFDATSLAQIAGDVGIKKPSIYAHFKSKEDLFLSLVGPAIERELDYARQMLLGGAPSAAALHAYLRDMEKRFETTPHMRFWLRILYLPPASLHAAVVGTMHGYMADMEALIRQAFERLPCGRFDADTLASAYLGIVDSLQAELLYGGQEKYRKRLSALWAVFMLALPESR